MKSLNSLTWKPEMFGLIDIGLNPPDKMRYTSDYVNNAAQIAAVCACPSGKCEV